MRHRQAGLKLGRNTHQRQALFKQQAGALILNESVKTTLAKAKLLVRLTDKLISRAKKGTLASRRQLLAFFNRRPVVNKLVDDIALRNKTRTSGFTKLIRLGVRRSDNAMIAQVELIDKKK
ncbi:MAG: 50S ribosomal protein L17 [Candidatus Beckwithbacteria bacterium GW2011_GWA2_43_10]|uniref:50S ribosomal protein L17 n=1 Tax=Candidatus Beckwithbacteria bacterium GW2011_GWA2_43_10 TaxID=1618369 RepID=A0A0G1C5E1_9BACT|nr:MAG: 50S ribosomal protein L17 [Candidatus Beckwithbacteria bacterium GW2011_GWA2_43_10]